MSLSKRSEESESIAVSKCGNVAKHEARSSSLVRQAVRQVLMSACQLTFQYEALGAAFFRFDASALLIQCD